MGRPVGPRSWRVTPCRGAACREEAMSPSVPTTPPVDVVDESGGDKGL